MTSARRSRSQRTALSRRSKSALAMVTVASTLPALAILGLSATPAVAGVCLGKQTTVSGHKALIFCGPATATLTVGGATHRFSGGMCTGGGSYLSMSLGEAVTGAGAGNAGKTTFGIIINGKTADVSAAVGGHDLTKSGLALATVPHGAATKGVFHGKLITNGKPFSGSWNCHGAIVST